MNAYATHLLIVVLVCAATWFLFINFWPRLLLSVFKRALLVRGFGEGPIPLNTLYTQPLQLFAEPLSAQSASSSNLMTVGVNHDTLVTVAWLDLAKEPLVLHVPAMDARYYSVQFTNPAHNTNFAYVGTRATGSQAGDYLISGPAWRGSPPAGMPHIAAPNSAVLVLARVLVYSDGDLEAAYALSKQFQLAPLSRWQPAART